MTAFCHGCQTGRAIDRHWRALWIDSAGDLHATRPELACDLDFERPGTALACGQECSLRIFERYLHTGSFDPIPAADPDLLYEQAIHSIFQPNAL